MKWWVLAVVSWQSTRTLMLSGNNSEAVGRASQNYRHSRIYCLLRKRQTPRWRRARKNSSLFCFFSLVPLSAPSLYTVAHFSDITAHSALPRFATGAHENPRNEVASFQRLASANISSRVSMQFQRQFATCQVERSPLIRNERTLPPQREESA